MLDAAVTQLARAIAAAPYPRAETRAVQADTDVVEVFFDVSAPPPGLVLFGAGHDAIPLAALAQEHGWRVTVVDVRAAFTTPERFPGARLVLAHPSQFGSHVPLDARSHVVVMNHHLERDAATLTHVLGTPVPWIGVLGPRSRYEKLLEAVSAAAGSTRLPRRWRASAIPSASISAPSRPTKWPSPSSPP